MSCFNSILPIGAIAKVFDREPSVYLAEISNLGLSYCQLGGTNDNLLFGSGRSDRISVLRETAADLGITITAVWIPFKGQSGVFSEFRSTHGLVPEATRSERLLRSCMTSMLAKELGVELVAAHIGFIPDDPADPVYKSFINDFRFFLQFCENNGQKFIFETGQVSVSTLERVFAELDMPNFGLNFDPANMLMYDYDDPMYMLEKLGQYVLNVHCKDGKRPTEPGKLGPETLFGKGDIDAAAILKKLYEIGYRGPLIIEREISGEQQKLDIEYTVKYINEIKKSLC